MHFFIDTTATHKKIRAVARRRTSTCSPISALTKLGRWTDLNLIHIDPPDGKQSVLIWQSYEYARLTQQKILGKQR